MDQKRARKELALPQPWNADDSRGSASPLSTCTHTACVYPPPLLKSMLLSTAGYLSFGPGYLSFGPMAQCVVHALKSLACRASPSRARRGHKKHKICSSMGPKLSYPTGTMCLFFYCVAAHPLRGHGDACWAWRGHVRAALAHWHTNAGRGECVLHI